jgi:DNA-binding NarL/FixJ family response regulator
MAIVHDLARGWDIAQIAERRHRSLSSVYEIAGRICARLGLDEWTQIKPYAIEHGLVAPEDPDSSGQD